MYSSSVFVTRCGFLSLLVFCILGFFLLLVAMFVCADMPLFGLLVVASFPVVVLLHACVLFCWISCNILIL